MNYQLNFVHGEFLQRDQISQSGLLVGGIVPRQAKNDAPADPQPILKTEQLATSLRTALRQNLGGSTSVITAFKLPVAQDSSENAEINCKNWRIFNADVSRRR